MSVIEYRKLKCDECGKEEVVEGGGSYPSGWIVIGIAEWDGSIGEGRFEKEVCSDDCAINLMTQIKEIPPKTKVTLY